MLNSIFSINCRLILLLLWSSYCLVGTALQGAVPLAVYLTWVRQPETTMVVQWITPVNDANTDIVLFQPKDPAEASLYRVARGSRVILPEAPTICVHSAELVDLSPSTSYRFLLSGALEPYYFRTLSAVLDNPLRFVVGGDMYEGDLAMVRQMSRHAAATQPAFAIIGGDIAYAASRHASRPQDLSKWLKWLNAWSEDMVTPDGHLIPMLPILGNHDVSGGYDQTATQAHPFHAFFKMPGSQGFAVLDCGKDVSIFLLDSGHTNAVDGVQKLWLAEALNARKHRPYLFASYHVPAYPSYRSFHNARSIAIRRHWVPLFEAMHLTAAFENHDHCYKRSFPILNGKVDPGGVLYLGDGAWGIKHVRRPRTPAQSWYLAASAARRHVSVITLSSDKMEITSIDDQGHPFDTFTKSRYIMPHRANESQEGGAPIMEAADFQNDGDDREKPL
jgi:hypothetical protein